MKSVGEGDYIFPKSVKQMYCVRHFNSIKRNRSDAKILVKSIMSNRSPVNMFRYNCLSQFLNKFTFVSDSLCARNICVSLAVKSCHFSFLGYVCSDVLWK